MLLHWKSLIIESPTIGVHMYLLDSFAQFSLQNFTILITVGTSLSEQLRLTNARYLRPEKVHHFGCFIYKFILKGKEEEHKMDPINQREALAATFSQIYDGLSLSEVKVK